jgi:hypothetical protein
MIAPLDIGKSRSDTRDLLLDRFRCRPDAVANFAIDRFPSSEAGYFTFGPDITCHGQCSSARPAKSPAAVLSDADESVRLDPLSVHLPFDPVQVIDNLRCERYTEPAKGVQPLPGNGVVRSLYYFLRPVLWNSLRRRLQKLYFRGWEKTVFPKWPVDCTVEDIHERLLLRSMRAENVDRVPFIWFWPKGAGSCTILTHDVETSAGLGLCERIMDLDDSFGMKASFQIIPEKRYTVSDALLERFRSRGFEINVHDLNHDGHLFENLPEFRRRAKQINSYARKFGAAGFRSAAMYRHADWHDALDFAYDMSIPNVAHLDPQQGGCCTVFPFFAGNMLELPVTTTQDYSLFQILTDYSMRLWKAQATLIREKHGLMSFIVHPDYLIEDAAQRVYIELLQYLKELRAQNETWVALPREVANWWRLRGAMELVKAGRTWRVEGPGSERASVAYAIANGDGLAYEIESPDSLNFN